MEFDTLSRYYEIVFLLKEIPWVKAICIGFIGAFLYLWHFMICVNLLKPFWHKNLTVLIFLSFQIEDYTFTYERS